MFLANNPVGKIAEKAVRKSVFIGFIRKYYPNEIFQLSSS